MAVQAAQNAAQSVAQGAQAVMTPGAGGGGATTNSMVGVGVAVVAGLAIAAGMLASQGGEMQLLRLAPSLPPSLSVSLCGETEILRDARI